MGSTARSLRTANTACDGRTTSAGDSLFTCCVHCRSCPESVAVVGVGVQMIVDCHWLEGQIFIFFIFGCLTICAGLAGLPLFPQHLRLSPAALKIHQRRRRIVGRFLLEGDAALMLSHFGDVQ